MDWGVFFITYLIVCFILGVIGFVLGSTINKAEAGFWLGAFLGPIGFIILFLLPRETSIGTIEEGKKSNAVPLDPPCERDLNVDAYKIWLTSKYEIVKNNTFDQFICDDRLFDSLEETLKFADSLDQQEQQAQAKEKKEQEVKKLSDEEKRQKVIDEEKRQKAIDDDYIDPRISVAIFLVIMIVFVLFMLFVNFVK